MQVRLPTEPSCQPSISLNTLLHFWLPTFFFLKTLLYYQPVFTQIPSFFFYATISSLKKYLKNSFSVFLIIHFFV